MKLARLIGVLVVLSLTGCTHWQQTTTMTDHRVVSSTIVSDPYEVVEVDGTTSCRAIAEVETAETWVVDYEKRQQMQDFAFATGLVVTGASLAFLGQERLLSVGDWHPVRGGAASPLLLTGAGVAFAGATAVLGYAIVFGDEGRRPSPPKTVQRVVRHKRAIDAVGCGEPASAPTHAMIRDGRLLSAVEVVVQAQD